MAGDPGTPTRRGAVEKAAELSLPGSCGACAARLCEGPPTREDFNVKLGKFTCQNGPEMIRFGRSRCHGWIGARKLPLVDLPRTPTDFWDPFSDVVLGTLQIAPSDTGAK